jgi:hypothetical protein
LALKEQVISLSEEAKLVQIRKRMREIKHNERIAYVSLFIGVIIAAVGFVFPSPRFLGAAGIWMGVLGVIFAIIEGIGYAANSYLYSKLMHESKAIAKITSACPKCGKKIPKGKFESCPFCGSSLAQPRSRAKRTSLKHA